MALLEGLSFDTEKINLETEIDKFQTEERRCWWCEQQGRITIADRIKVIGYWATTACEKCAWNVTEELRREENY